MNKRKKSGTKRLRGTTRTRKNGEKTMGTFEDPSAQESEPGSQEQADDDNAKTARPPPPENGHLFAFLEHLEKTNIEAMKKEYAELKAYVPPEHAAPTFEANRSKNRYTDQLCYEHTRVKLTYNVPPDTDYIHANWTEVEDVGFKMICTQGPLKDTVNDFWRMAYQEKAAGIVMLCKNVENGKPKCSVYFNETAGEVNTYGTLQVRTFGTHMKDRYFEIITLEVGKKQDKFIPEMMVRLYLWLDWPDKYVPNTGLGLMKLIRKIGLGTKQNSGPIVIHCSAGVGRTGTVAAAAVCSGRIEAKKTISIFNIVKDLRSKRFNSVQTEIQYIYLHKCMCDYIRKKLAKTKSAALDNFYTEYEAYIRSQVTPA